MKIKVNLPRFVVFILFSMILAPNIAFATTPTFTNVSGTVASGSSITISGANLVSENTTTWNSVWSTSRAGFEGSSPIADGYDTPCGTYSTAVKLSGSQSLYTPDSGFSEYANMNYGGCRYSYNPQMADYAAGDNIYLRAYMRWDASAGEGEWPAVSQKLFWLGNDTGTSPDTYYVNFVTTGTAPTRLKAYATSINSGEWYYSNSFPALQDNRWYLVELRTHKYNGSQGPLQMWLDNQLIMDIPSGSGGTGVTDTTWGWEASTNHWGTTSGFNLKWWTDNFVIGGSRLGPASLVEIGDSANYATANKVYQPPTFISDGSVTITADLTGLSGDLYMWVTNDNDERSVAYSLGEGQVVAPTCSDGIQNGDETGVDCGGSCPVCTTTTPPPSGTLLFSETFEDGGFSSRGWYDNDSPILSTTEHITGSTSSAEFAFLAGNTIATNGGAMRHTFAETDSVFVQYYVKYSSNWVGSQVSYHPHEFYLMTTEDPIGDWSGMAYTHMTAYIEQNALTPKLAIQDGESVDQSNVGTNLVGTTENRAVAGCNGDSDGYGDGECFDTGGSIYSNAKKWDASSTISVNTWHKVEAYFKLNSISAGIGQADGVMQYWLDDTLLINHSDVVFRTGQRPDMKFNQFVITPYIGVGSPIAQTMWVDSLSLTTAPSIVLEPAQNLKIN